MYFDRDYSESEFINANKSYRGYKESDEVCDWLSEIFEEPVVLLRAEKERMMDLDPARLPFAKGTDRRGQFLTDGACHLINNQSIQSLMINIYNKYNDDPKALSRINADVNTFRPTFVIDEEYDDPYCEDELQEMRIANIMFRQLGPC